MRCCTVMFRLASDHENSTPRNNAENYHYGSYYFTLILKNSSHIYDIKVPKYSGARASLVNFNL